MKETLGLALPQDFKINLEVKPQDITLPYNHTTLKAVCDDPPDGFFYKYNWSDADDKDIPGGRNEEMKQMLEAVKNSSLNDPVLRLKDLNEGCHGFKITVTCCSKNKLTNFEVPFSETGLVNVDSGNLHF